MKRAPSITITIRLSDGERVQRDSIVAHSLDGGRGEYFIVETLRDDVRTIRENRALSFDATVAALAGQLRSYADDLESVNIEEPGK